MNDHHAPPATEKAADTQDAEYTSRVIKNFINNEATGDKSAGAPGQVSAGKNFHDRRDIIKVLTNMQTTFKADYVPGRDNNINTDEFKHSLLNSMAKLNSNVNVKSLSQIDGRTIDFIEMLFSEFLSDRNVANAVKTLILQLQIPLIKVSMLDNQFFYSNNHPARLVLDTIGHLGIGIEDQENTLYKTLQLIIEQLQTSFDQNTTSFNTALMALNRLTKIEKEKSDHTETETKQAFIKEHARHVILTELKRYTKNKIIPASINPLILKNWSNLMLQKYVQHGTESAEWKECIYYLKQIVSSSQPVTNKIRLLMLKTSSADLIDNIRSQLYLSKQDRTSIDIAINSLADIHKNLIESAAFEHSKTDHTEPQHSAAETVHDDHAEAQQQADEKLRKSKEQIAKLPKEVKIGAWFEIFNGADNIIRRVKLSMIMFDDAKLVFVDRVGNRVLEKQADQLLEELRSNKSRLLADHSIFNHALSNVINSITHKQAK